MYTILTDSCSDLNQQITSQFDHLEVLPLFYTLSGVTCCEPFDSEEKGTAFYDRLRAGETCTTSQIPPAEFFEAFKKHVQNGEAVLGLIFSSALSGTYASACIARDMVLEEIPDARIEIVDTLAASAGEGLIVYDALLNREAGMSLEDNAAWIRKRLQSYAHWFTVDDLHFLKRGGRCTPSAAFFGTMLKIKPVLHVDSEGRLIARSKVRGRMQALRAIAMKFGELGADKNQMIFISHGDCKKDALYAVIRRKLSSVWLDRSLAAIPVPVRSRSSSAAGIAADARTDDEVSPRVGERSAARRGSPGRRSYCMRRYGDFTGTQ